MVGDFGQDSRHEDVERAMREIARVQDPVVAGLITGLVHMQQEILLRLRVVEQKLDTTLTAVGATSVVGRRPRPKA